MGSQASAHCAGALANDTDLEPVGPRSPGGIFLGLCFFQLVAVDPAPGRNILQCACIGRYDLQQGTGRQVANSILCPDDGQRAQ